MTPTRRRSLMPGNPLRAPCRPRVGGGPGFEPLWIPAFAGMTGLRSCRPRESRFASRRGSGSPGNAPLWIPAPSAELRVSSTFAGMTMPCSSRQRLSDLVRPIPDQLDLQLEVDARILPYAPACFEQQLGPARGAGPAVVGEEVGVHSADLRLADSHSFQPRPFPQPAGEAAGR